ncbi:(S)-1-Phenylethanol dehydrogenase [Botrimarina colliarenosi]|uniref:(S)-1-Phenylethanol dehydrogenase n=1 Tax=Botrimarina colliarenosi TaxID=2528001 RepID=A0A5C6AKS1_9BACT|nr:SDR family oxidoreductase [Botrimarina colliarenosi]TWU00078.1 (S)-1-Phenylethanol dehydrogenase [Botrimarina colliarenosi]
MSFQVQTRTALVTGANRGIGAEIVSSLVTHGARKVYAGVRSAEKAKALVERFGDVIVPIEIDYEKPATIEAAAKAASDVELVVSNAGVLRTADPFADDALKNLQYELDINVFGLLRMARAFAPVLKKNGGGAFVQLNSVASLRSFPPFATYCASKAASYSLTQALRDTLREQGTAVLSVHPGPIDTDMGDHAGFDDSDPPLVVAEGIVAALAAGDFHLFPDKMAKQFGEAYAGFAAGVIDADPAE